MSFAPSDSSSEVLRKLFSTTAMSVPALWYMRSHSCSNAREKPTRATNAPMAMPIPQSVNRVLRRLRQRFFHANPVKDNWEAMILGRVLARWDLEKGPRAQFIERRQECLSNFKNSIKNHDRAAPAPAAATPQDSHPRSAAHLPRFADGRGNRPQSATLYLCRDSPLAEFGQE